MAKSRSARWKSCRRKHGYDLKLIPVDHPGQEQKSQWLQIRREKPDYVLMWGWGVMNQVAIQEAANIRFPMENFIGVWWSALNADADPAGDGANGYKALAMHMGGHGLSDFRRHAEALSMKRQGRGGGDQIGTVLYNRRHLCRIAGRRSRQNSAWRSMARLKSPRRMMRDGMEALGDHRREDGGAWLAGFGPEFTVSCENHGGPGLGAVQQWDASAGKWSLITDFMEPDSERHQRADRRRFAWPTPGKQHRDALQLIENLSRRRTCRRADTLLRFGIPDHARRRKTTETLLEVNNIEVIYNHVILVLKGVSLSVPKGGITALLGGNGAGKTTTLKAISNLLHASAARSPRARSSIAANGCRSEPVRSGARRHPGDGRAPLFRAPDRRGKPADRAPIRAQGRRRVDADLEMVYYVFPAPERAPQSQAGYTRAASSRCARLARADVAARDDPSGRASMGLAPQLVEEIFEIVKSLNEKEACLPSGRAEHQRGAALCALRLYPGIRPCGDGWPGRRTSRETRT